MAVRIVSFVGLKNERFSERYFIVGQKKKLIGYTQGQAIMILSATRITFTYACRIVGIIFVIIGNASSGILQFLMCTKTWQNERNLCFCGLFIGTSLFWSSYEWCSS